MPTIQEQLDWEEEMITRGADRFRTQQAKAEDTRGHETSAGSLLMRSYVLKIADQITLYVDGDHPKRRRNKFAPLIGTVDADKVAMFALREAISAIYKTDITMQTMLMNIGKYIEDELRFTQFQLEYKEYYDTLIRDFDRKKMVSYDHKRRVLRAKGADQGLDWQNWTGLEHVGCGGIVLGLLMEVCDLVERVEVPRRGRAGQVDVHIRPTEQCLDWIKQHNELAELTSPDRMPSLIEPDNWIGIEDGGYYSPRLRQKTPLIKHKDRLAKEQRAVYEAAVMPQVYDAVNAMQGTVWQINSRVLEVMTDIWRKDLGCGLPNSQPITIPPSPLPEGMKVADAPLAYVQAFTEWKAIARNLYTLEKERVAKNLAMSRTMRIAREMDKHPEFYYVWQLDFRGRAYCAASGLSPQGTSQSKALIQFANAKELKNANGVKWFKINGANKYGHDKGSNADRVRWIDSQSDKWEAIARNPLSHRELWGHCDKPFQFLAWCFEYADYLSADRAGKGYAFRSRLPVGQDGSCNGLQHFSAMLRDRIGGEAVNLTPAELPADIYQRVGDVLTEKLQREARNGSNAALNWLAVLPERKVPRSLTKKSVMTLPYGAVQHSATDAIYIWVYENKAKFDENTEFKHCIYLAPLLWASISEVVVAARAAMDWVQECTGRISAKKQSLSYTSYLGFPVWQRTNTARIVKIETQIAGRLQLRFNTSTDKINARKQKQGSSPNLIHHVDATHMMMVLCRAYLAGMRDFAMIHDDFGTHACDTEEFNKIIRETFVELHGNWDVLSVFKEAHEINGIVLPEIPAAGDLDLNGVLDSEYFFA